MIPARYAASRFPAKLMQPLGGKTVIAQTYLAAVRSGLFDEVVVVSDTDIIRQEIEGHGGRVIMSHGQHESGTDRIAEAAADLDVDVIVNVQGDTPFVTTEQLRLLLEQFNDTTVQVASLMQVLRDEATIQNPNCVKVCVDKHNNSLFFSRSVIPFPRATDISITHYKHIGVYAFRKKALMEFTTWPMSPLEAAEKIECLRFLENGVQLRMVLTDYVGVEIDTPEDLEKASRLFS